MTLHPSLAAAAALVLCTATAHAELLPRGNGMVYDTVMNITWLSDFNYAKTSGYSPDGLLTQDEAVTWAEALVHGGFDDWRLPVANYDDTNCSHSVVRSQGLSPLRTGYNCIGSEMGHLHYIDFGARMNGEMTHGTHAANLALFSNIQLADPAQGTGAYWLSDKPYPYNTDFGGVFWSFVGSQGYDFAGARRWTVAVRDGDVLAVPEPTSALLMALGLGAVLAAGRRGR